MSSSMKEARRAPGSEWLKNQTRFLELVYKISEKTFLKSYPLLKRIPFFKGIMTTGEAVGKGWLFNCQMCGQCVLHSTGMTCPMNCPKNVRNGPCGGVRANGHCEVIPEMRCVWVQAWERSQHMSVYGQEIKLIQPPVNRTLQNTSSWVSMAEGIDSKTPAGWQQVASTTKGDRHDRLSH